MTFYQELQLSSGESKKYISAFEKPKDKAKHIAVFVLKVLLNVAFSTAFVTLFSLLFGQENAIPGLVVLLFIMAFRFTDLDIKVSHSVGVIFIIFGILAFGPKLANMVSVGWSFCINLGCIFALVFFGCHDTKKCNHFTIVLSYILLLSSDVEWGWSYGKRFLCLLVGAILTALVFIHQHHKKAIDGGFTKIFKGFGLSSESSRWQIKFSLCVSSAMLFASLLGLTKFTWVGIAAMSVYFPSGELIGYRTQYRVLGNILGSLVFLGVYMLLPQSITGSGYIGIIGGIGVGFSMLYGWQSLWNSFSAVSVAALIYGTKIAVFYRIFNNVAGAMYALLFELIFERILLYMLRFYEFIKSGIANKRENKKRACAAACADSYSDDNFTNDSLVVENGSDESSIDDGYSNEICCSDKNSDEDTEE